MVASLNFLVSCSSRCLWRAACQFGAVGELTKAKDCSKSKSVASTAADALANLARWPRGGRQRQADSAFDRTVKCVRRGAGFTKGNTVQRRRVSNLIRDLEHK